MKKIYVLATGGTIASKVENRVSTLGYDGPVIKVESLISNIPELTEIADIKAEQVIFKPSLEINFTDLKILSDRINELFKSNECDGIVVTHGTDTMEETAYFLNLMINSEKPVVVTGSMRPEGVISPDGGFNLYDAVCCAVSDQSYGMGVVIAMNNLILSARDAIKFYTFKTDAFQAPLYGALGTVRNGCVSYRYKPIRRHTVTSEFIGTEINSSKVEIVYMYQGCTDLLFKAAIEAGCKGIITAGTGDGNIIKSIKNLYDSKKSIDSSLPILVRSFRLTAGDVSSYVTHNYSKIISAEDISPQKAYILLNLALSHTDDPKEIRRIFNEY